MNNYKRHNIQKLIVEQAGTERLILNDLILGRDGAETLAQLLPEYHSELLHLEIKGNNIDSEGFEAIFTALLHCPNLVTFQAEWNNLGSGPSGLLALLRLVQTLRFLELLDLKNNKISHQSAGILAEIVKTNSRSLTVLDLRWNDLGQVGAQILYPSLAFNAGLKYLGLEDNRISGQTLLQITEYLKSGARGSASLVAPLVRNQTVVNWMPISDDAYPSMDVQLKGQQLRTKIENQQQEALLAQEKLQLQIQKVTQRIRVKASQIHEAQVKFDFLTTENVNTLNSLREAERVYGIIKEKYFGTEKYFNHDKSSLRSQKHQISNKMQVAIEKISHRQQREIEDLTIVMQQKYERLSAYLRDKANQKRVSREKIAELKEDITKFRLIKEGAWDKVTLATTTATRKRWEQECRVLEDLVAKTEAAVRAERKKGDYLTEELNSFVLRGLSKEEKAEQDIFELQNRIKDLHKAMTLANLAIEESQIKAVLRQSDIAEREADIDLTRRYVKYIQSEVNVNIDIERLKGDEDIRGDRFREQTLEMRITELEQAVRHQTTQNLLIQNHYEKMLSQLQSLTKSAIHQVLFA